MKGNKRLCETIPRFFGGGFGEEKGQGYYLILEDITSKGFSMADFNRGLDPRQVVSVTKSLGYFHGLSYSFLKENPGKTYPYLNTFYTSPGIEGLVEDISSFTLNILIKDVEGTKDSDLIGYVSGIGKKLSERIRGFMDSGKAKMFTHGDFWGNNFMFGGDDGESVAFVDWQFFGIECPYFDLGLASLLSMDKDKTEENLVKRI